MKKVLKQIISLFSEHEMSIKAFLISIISEDNTSGHAMAAFPCKNDIVLCNSWGNNCYETIADFVNSTNNPKNENYALRNYSLQNITLVI